MKNSKKMNLEEENGIRDAMNFQSIPDAMNFLHSDHTTVYDYNRDKLGSENIHASVSLFFNTFGRKTE